MAEVLHNSICAIYVDDLPCLMWWLWWVLQFAWGRLWFGFWLLFLGWHVGWVVLITVSRVACVVAGCDVLRLCWADVFGGEPCRADVACWGGVGASLPALLSLAKATRHPVTAPLRCPGEIHARCLSPVLRVAFPGSPLEFRKRQLLSQSCGAVSRSRWKRVAGRQRGRRKPSHGELQSSRRTRDRTGKGEPSDNLCSRRAEDGSP